MHLFQLNNLKYWIYYSLNVAPKFQLFSSSDLTKKQKFYFCKSICNDTQKLYSKYSGHYRIMRYVLKSQTRLCRVTFPWNWTITAFYLNGRTIEFVQTIASIFMHRCQNNVAKTISLMLKMLFETFVQVGRRSRSHLNVRSSNGF